MVTGVSLVNQHFHYHCSEQQLMAIATPNACCLSQRAPDSSEMHWQRASHTHELGAIKMKAGNRIEKIRKIFQGNIFLGKYIFPQPVSSFKTSPKRIKNFLEIQKPKHLIK